MRAGMCSSRRVQCRAFTGEVEAWILRANWTTFSNQLETLERTRRGEALLESISPGELRLRIQSIDALGHMGVDGELAGSFHGDGRQRQVVHLRFGLVEFDPTMLPGLVAELAATIHALDQRAG
jgi:hypothetical protein